MKIAPSRKMLGGLTKSVAYDLLHQIIVSEDHSIYWGNKSALDDLLTNGCIQSFDKNGYDSFNFKLSIKGIWLYFLLKKHYDKR